MSKRSYIFDDKKFLGHTFLSDCFEAFPLINDNSIDMILCDLPYGTTQNKWDSVLNLNLLWKEYERVIKDNGVIVLTAQTPFDKVLGSSNLKLLKYEWIWQKDKATGHLNSKKMPMKEHENILIFYKNPPKYFPQMTEGNACHSRGNSLGTNSKSSNYGNHKNVETLGNLKYPKSIIKFNKDTGLHPNQKPVALIEYLIKTYTNEGETVLDFTAGSGTTGLACQNTNRNYILIEKEQQYIDIIKERLSKI